MSLIKVFDRKGEICEGMDRNTLCLRSDHPDDTC